MKFIYFLTLLVCSFSVAHAQLMPACGQQEALSALLARDPQMLSRHLDIENRLYNETSLGSNSHQSRSGNALYVLPVVVHIIHNNGTENITDAQVMQGIQDLNEAFANIAYYDSTTGVDVQIQFCLAKQDPNGNLTNGITRNVSASTVMNMQTDDLKVKNLNRWDPRCYINFWLVKSICNSPGNCNIGGYAYFPSAHGSSVDGIVQLAGYFGASRGNSCVQVHEMGHYLGLYHTFEGGCSNSNCMVNGDKVCDTPPDNSTAYYACNATVNTCSTDAQSGFSTDQDDLNLDYMDYGNLNCMSVFTQGQKDRMLWTVSRVRSSLLNCKSCLDPCTSPSQAAFTVSQHAVAAGAMVNFTNTSVNAGSYTWYINNAQFSTAVSPSYVFNNTGAYIIRLHAENSDPNCPSDFTDTILVTCSVQAAFAQSASQVSQGGQVTFTNQSVNATTYTWFVDGVQQATTLNFTYTFNITGDHFVYLVASNGICTDTTTILNFIHVGPVCSASFTNIPDTPTTCSATYFIPDTTCQFSNYYWSFCDQDGLGTVSNSDYSTTVSGLGATNPNGGTMYRDKNGDYYVFFADYSNSGASNRFYRMSFGNSISNTPVTSGITINGISDIRSHAISIVEENGVYYALLVTNVYLYRVKIGASLSNNNWTATIVGNMTNAVSWAHDLEVVQDKGNYWVLIANRNGFITVAFLGNHIENTPFTVSKYSSNNLNRDSYFGLFHVADKGNHYVFGTDFTNGLKRYDFGTSLGNTPTITNLGFLGGQNSLVCDINLWQKCDGSYEGVLVKENLSDHKLLTFASITATPASTTLVSSLPRLGGITPFMVTDMGITAFACQPYFQKMTRINFSAQCNSSALFSSAEFPAPVSFTVPGPHKVRFVVDQGLSSQSIFCKTINIKPADVFPLELGPDISMCGQTPVQLKAGPAFTTYKWQDGFADSVYTAYLPGKYSVTVTDFCGRTFTDSVSISMDSATAIILSDTSVCGTGGVILSAPAGYTDYLWSPGANVVCPTCSTTVAHPDSNTVYTLQARKNSCVTIASKQVSIGAGAPVSITASKNLICSSDSAQICATPGFAIYNWNTGEHSPCISTSLAGNYYVSAGADSSCMAASNTVAIAVYPASSVSVVVNGDTLLSFGAASYQWYYNGVLIPGATSSMYVAVQAGYYSVEVTDANGCKSRSAPVQVGDNAIGGLNQMGLYVYPNPSYNGRWLLNAETGWLNSRLEVTDMQGRKIYTTVIEKAQTEIVLDAAPAAIYILHIYNAGKNASGKLMKW